MTRHTGARALSVAVLLAARPAVASIRFEFSGYRSERPEPRLQATR